MTVEAREFQILESPLQGVNLIEASAGTGKTYTIAALYVRFILEEGLHPESILVVTFTEAATQELRARIRKRLRDTLDAMVAGGSPDPFLNAVARGREDPSRARDRLTTALRDFDQSAIFTIHGFCHRVLQDNAFESGSLFDTELITDQNALKREIIEDFWRRELYEASPLVVHFLLEGGLSPEALVRSFARGIVDPEMAVTPQVDRPALEWLETSERALRKDVERLVELWPGARDAVRGLLIAASLHASAYGKSDRIDPTTGVSAREAKVSRWIETMDRYVLERPLEMPLPLPEALRWLTAGEIHARTTGEIKAPPSHPLFDLCQSIQEASDTIRSWASRYLTHLKGEAFRVLHRELPERKRRQNVQHFDDLLLRVAQGLQEAGGDALAASVRERYRVALIDEFQDTDVVQYAIFSTLFGTPGRSLFLIGDPKQAIYGFRGADVFAYMEAARRVERRYTLSTNRRSEVKLIAGVNALFGAAAPAFVYPEIGFHPAVGPPDQTPDPLILGGTPAVPVQLWYFEAPSDSGEAGTTGRKPPGVLTKRDAEALVVQAVTAEISRLLRSSSEGRATLGGRPLRESDIAVLVRRRVEARRAQSALARLRIPSVLTSEEDVFDSPEAAEMGRLIRGVCEPHREGLVRSALATRLLGIDGERLFELTTNDALWEQWLLKFSGWLQLWQQRGFMRMFRQVMVDQSVRSRLVGLSGGERRITNVLHIAEILHQESVERGLSPLELVKWMTDRSNPEITRTEIHPLRLESDENAVRIVTIHKSKGLQYPIVFCPFCWGSSDLHDPKSGFSFHDERNRRRLTLCLDPEDADGRAMAERESLAENIRLLYVAVTRAQKRVYLAHGSFSGADTSSLAYLLHASHDGSPTPDSLAGLRSAWGSLTQEDRIRQLRTLEARSGDSIRVVTNPPTQPAAYQARTDAPPSLACRTFEGHIDRTWRISSFSSLTSASAAEVELPDRDSPPDGASPPESGAAPESPQQERQDIFSFPAGTRSGLLVHSVLEELDFANGDPRHLEEVLSRKCLEYGFAPAWRDVLRTAIQNVLSVRLGFGSDSFSLSRLGLPDRLTELEFTFPLGNLTVEDLTALLARHGIAPATAREPDGAPHPHAPGVPHWNRLRFQPATGFMKGFIDLVLRFEGRFYLVDWKTNHLGYRLEDYAPAALEAAMQHAHYPLQALLYTVALDRFLAGRLPGYAYESHFGEAYYLFVRGIHPEVSDSSGVYRMRPTRELIRELGALLFPG